MTEPATGLRERKKARLRREISDVATRLFAKHGFEQVTLAQIAEAAEVSVKTIFNHFGSKEELYFDRAGEAEETFARTITERAPGVTSLAALRSLLVENVVPFVGRGWDGADDPRLRAFFATQDRSPALQARRLVLAEELAGRLRTVLAEQLDRDPDDPPLLSFVAMLTAALALRDRVLREALAEKLPAAEVRRRVTTVVDDAFVRLERAFADVDLPPF
jgi:AcrR family transcriptional regulator